MTDSNPIWDALKDARIPELESQLAACKTGKTMHRGKV